MLLRFYISTGHQKKGGKYKKIKSPIKLNSNKKLLILFIISD